MKRNLLRLIALIGIMTLITGCAAPQEETSGGKDGKETIEFVYWAGAQGEEAAFSELIAKFEEENPAIKIKASLVPPPNNGDYYSKLQTRFAAGDAPDIFRSQYQKFGEFSSQGALLDVTDLFEKEKVNFNSSLITAVSYDNKIFGLPHHTDTIAVFYNKTYFDKLGIKAPEKLEDAWTWEEFLEIGKKIKDEGLAKNGIGVAWNATSAYRSIPFFSQHGAALLTDDLKSGNIATKEGVETFSFLKKMYKETMSPGNSLKSSDDYNMLFTSGNVGMLINGNWMIPKFESDMKDFEWGVTYMPKNETASSDLGGNGLAIAAETKHAKAAKKFLSFMGEKENMKYFVEKGLFLPGRTDISDFTYQLKDPKMMNVFINQATTIPEQQAKVVTSTNFSTINQALADSLDELFTSDASPEKTAKELNKKINELVKK
ncbi:MAG: sugar ABC transporter substrate-binding protein [Bacillus sp. (in: firmicutes)]